MGKSFLRAPSPCAEGFGSCRAALHLLGATHIFFGRPQNSQLANRWLRGSYNVNDTPLSDPKVYFGFHFPYHSRSRSHSFAYCGGRPITLDPKQIHPHQSLSRPHISLTLSRKFDICWRLLARLLPGSLHNAWRLKAQFTGLAPKAL